MMDGPEAVFTYSAKVSVISFQEYEVELDHD